MKRHTVKLHMQKGTDEVNYGTESFKVGMDGYVEVPIEAVESLVREGGAIIVLPESPPEGYVKVRHISDPDASFSFDGVIYVADDDGIIHAPHACLVHIENHGFIVC